MSKTLNSLSINSAVQNRSWSLPAATLPQRRILACRSSFSACYWWGLWRISPVRCPKGRRNRRRAWYIRWWSWHRPIVREREAASCSDFISNLRESRRIESWLRGTVRTHSRLAQCTLDRVCHAICSVSNTQDLAVAIPWRPQKSSSFRSSSHILQPWALHAWLTLDRGSLGEEVLNFIFLGHSVLSPCCSKHNKAMELNWETCARTLPSSSSFPANR